MPIRVKCDACKKTLSVKDHLAGKKIKCPLCQTVVVVPNPGPAKESSPAAKTAPAAKKPAAGIPAPVPGGTKRTQPIKAKSPSPSKSASPKPATNGTPPVAKANGTPAPPAPPPEDLEKEALSAWADEPPPPEEAEDPKTIDFTCQWCDEMLHLPIELGGKQTQCPNEECGRIIKVPLPKVPEKKDWRKVRVGPAGALTNQPEELDNAWGTEQTTRARQDSLAQAGAIETPPKPPRGIFGWLYLAFIGMVIVAGLGAATLGGIRLIGNKQSLNALKETKSLVDPTNGPKVKDPLLQAEVFRAAALLSLREGKAVDAEDFFTGALSLIGDTPSINDQMFLIDLARSQIELGGNEDEQIQKTKRSWESVRGLLRSTLEKCKDSEVQVAALRDAATRLVAINQDDLALVLADGLANSAIGKSAVRSPAYRQAMALRIIRGDDKKADAKMKRPEPKEGQDLGDGNTRVGYAEGLARKGEIEDALKLATHKGLLRDRFDACVGVASLLLADAKHKDKAAPFVKEAITISKEKGNDKLTPWQILLLTRAAVRTEDADTVKALMERQKEPFRLRAHLEMFLGKCEQTNSALDADSLAMIESADKEGQTLALAWLALAAHNAKHGYTRSRNRQMFETRMPLANLPEAIVELVRPMVDVGTHLGSLKTLP